jgi:hypothetical protein
MPHTMCIVESFTSSSTSKILNNLSDQYNLQIFIDQLEIIAKCSFTSFFAMRALAENSLMSHVCVFVHDEERVIKI